MLNTHSFSVKLLLSSHLVQTPDMCLAYNHRSKIQYGGGPDKTTLSRHGLGLSHTSKIQYALIRHVWLTASHYKYNMVEALTDCFDQTCVWLTATFQKYNTLEALTDFFDQTCVWLTATHQKYNTVEALTEDRLDQTPP